MSLDVGAVATAASAALVGTLTMVQSVRSDRRADARAARLQHRLLVGYVSDLLHWARRVEPTTAAGPIPEPPDELDLGPWI